MFAFGEEAVERETGETADDHKNRRQDRAIDPLQEGDGLQDYYGYYGYYSYYGGISIHFATSLENVDRDRFHRSDTGRWKWRKSTGQGD